MKKMLLLSGAMLLVCASVAAASSLSIAWDTCLGDGGGNLRAFACTSNLNTGANANVVVPSITPDADIANFNGFDTHCLITTGVPLPAWYGVNGSCAGKTGPIAASSSQSLCSNDPFAALGGGGAVPLTGTDLMPNPNTVQVRFAFAVPAGSEQLLFAGTEYPTCNFTISNAKTTGTGSCAGCSEPAQIAFDMVTFGQAGGLATDVHGDANSRCYGNGVPVATKNQTWGAVKALYR
jgi:hypothetical protein